MMHPRQQLAMALAGKGSQRGNGTCGIHLGDLGDEESCRPGSPQRGVGAVAGTGGGSELGAHFWLSSSVASDGPSQLRNKLSASL